MSIIKRYPNRKLYNTGTRQYITLEGIAELIRGGETVQVVDNVTGDDLTAVTLSQIIFEQEKKLGGFLPQSILTSLIRAGRSGLESIYQNLLSVAEWQRQIDVAIEQRLDRLVGRGELAPEDGRRLRDKLLSPDDSAGAPRLRNSDSEAPFEGHRLPTPDDLAKIKNQLDELIVRLDRLSREVGQETGRN